MRERFPLEQEGQRASATRGYLALFATPQPIFHLSLTTSLALRFADAVTRATSAIVSTFAVADAVCVRVVLHFYHEHTGVAIRHCRHAVLGRALDVGHHRSARQRGHRGAVWGVREDHHATLCVGDEEVVGKRGNAVDFLLCWVVLLFVFVYFVLLEDGVWAVSPQWLKFE